MKLLARYRVWFTKDWEPRIGPYAAELKYRAALWSLAAGASILLMMLFSALFAAVFGLPEMTLLIVPLGLIGYFYASHQISKSKKLVQAAVVEYLPFKLNPGVIPISTPAIYDRWLARVKPHSQPK